MWAAVAMEEMDVEDVTAGWIRRMYRWGLGLVLLPLCWVTTWTFLARFSEATIHQGFWQSHEFWHFITGALVMTGWFWSGLGRSFFLYLYVFGHELTHAFFVKVCGGKVLDIKWGSDGGYVTTDKTNWVIALSPYFVPFWTLVTVVCYALVKVFFEVEAFLDLVFYGLVGATWAFQMVFTLWMIPRDQPDLKDNGTFLSLVLIYFGNLVVLISLLCVSANDPMADFKAFGSDWLRFSATWVDVGIRWFEQQMGRFSEFLRL